MINKYLYILRIYHFYLNHYSSMDRLALIAQANSGGTDVSREFIGSQLIAPQPVTILLAVPRCFQWNRILTTSSSGPSAGSKNGVAPRRALQISALRRARSVRLGPILGAGRWTPYLFH